jgi:hypothetical protein
MHGVTKKGQRFFFFGRAKSDLKFEKWHLGKELPSGAGWR